MSEIGEPAQDHPRSRADDILAASERAARETLEDALEKALEEEAVELLSARPELRRARPVHRELGYKGFRLSVRVPRLRLPNGELRFPPRFEELSQDPNKVLLLRRYGVTTRNVPAVLEGIYGERVPGTSRSNVSRDDIEAGEKAALSALQKRTFHDQSIVAVALDGTAIGTRNRKRTVMIVVGVRADGTRLLLDTFVAQHERTGDITPRLRRLVERGVSPDVYWVADSGAGIRGALRAIGAENVGTCTTHAVGNATAELPAEIEERFRLKLYGALSEDAPEAALARLDAVEAELRALGHEKQANSLRAGKQGMIKTQELGLKGELRTQLRSTNVLVEGQNHTLKVRLRDVARWRDDQMRIRWVAKRCLELERDSWKRLADPKGLVELGERLGLSRVDAGTIVAGLPPSLSIRRVATPLAEIEELGRPGARWLADSPEATWFGAPEALAKLGVTAGGAVGADELSRAMRGAHTASGDRVRKPSEVKVVVRGEDGEPKEGKVPGVLNLEWELSAPPAFMSRWRGATEEQRLELEATFEAAATTAIERATKSTQTGHGFAGAAVLSRPSPEAPEAESVLRMSGLTVGISRGSGAELNSPARAESLSAVSRDGEDDAKAVLAVALEHRSAPPALSAHPPEEPSAAVLAGVELRALEKAPRMVGTPDGLASTAAGDEGAGKAELRRACGEASGWWKANRTAAAGQIAAARLQDPAAAKRDLWFPLTPGRRLLLGKERASELRADAARLVGRASANEDFAKELREFDGDPLAELETAVGRVDGLAEAIAARREIDRRELFATPAARTPPAPPAEVPILDSRGSPAKRPVERNRRALGRHAIALHRYAAAIAPEVAELGPEHLADLIAELGEPWRDLSPSAGFRHARLEERREAELSRLLLAEYRAGHDLETARTAEAKGDAGGAFAASDGRHAAETQRLRRELGRIDREIEDARRQGEGLEAERFVRQHPEAAVYDAAFAEAQRRELAQVRQTADVGMDVDI